MKKIRSWVPPGRSIRLALMMGCAVAWMVPTAVGQVEPPRHPLGEYARYQWQLSPAAEPDLALKYDFRVPIDEIVPANGAEVYLRAVLRSKSIDSATQKQFSERYDVWYDSPLDELPVDEIKEWLAQHEQVLVEIDRATRCRECNWELSFRDFAEFNEVVWVRLDEYQDLRQLARILRLKTRVELAEGNYDEAIRTIGMSIRLGTDAARAPLLICGLIGAACVGIGTESLEELIAAGESPNTYWAIASLPHTPVEMGSAIENEVRLITTGFEYLRDPETTFRTADQWQEVMGRDFCKLMNAAQPEGTMTETQGQLMATGFAMRGYPMAKRELIADGMAPDVIEAMPVGQVVAIHQSRLYEQAYHEVRKCTLLPDRLAWQYTSQIDERLAEIGLLVAGDESREIFPFVKMLLPAIDAAHIVPIRIKRKFALLQTVEAIRAYLAENENRFPESLDDLSRLPAIDDPMTGDPFRYTRTEAGATIVVEVPDRYSPQGLGGVYELTVREP